MNDKQKKIRVLISELSIPENAELVEVLIEDLELRLLREIKTGIISIKDFAKKVGRFASHIHSWHRGSPAAITKIIEMGKKYK